MKQFVDYLAEELNDASLQIPVDVNDPAVRADINQALMDLDKQFLSAEAGLEMLRSILSQYGADFSFSVEAEMPDDDYECEEVVSIEGTNYFLYINYGLTDDGYYEFYSEIVDENELEEIMSISGEDYEEE
jgi:hypothetical protein